MLTEKELITLMMKDIKLYEYYFKKGIPRYEEKFFCLCRINRFDFEIVSDFHIDHAETLELSDEYFCGMRSNHFALIYGCKEREEYNPYRRSVIIFATHEGTLEGDLIKFYLEDLED